MNSILEPPNRSSPSPLNQAKNRLTIFAAWPALGLPGMPKKICRSPFRDDRKASFSISDDGKLFHDFATGDAGNIVDFVARARGCSPSDAAREVIRLAAVVAERQMGAFLKVMPKNKGGNQPVVINNRLNGTPTLAEIGITKKQSATSEKLANMPVPPPCASVSKKCLRVPALTRPTISDLAEIQHIRRWPFFAGLEIAVQRGLLHTCSMCDDGTTRRAWAITDSARHAVQVRRLDGLPWAWNNSKAWTLGGSTAGWPIGTADIGGHPLVLLCEGGPDFLAGHGLAWLAGLHNKVGVVGVLGASLSICPDALPHFAKRRIRIFEHADQAGADAGARWAAQLRQAGAVVDGFTFAPPYKDLSDVFAATDTDAEPLAASTDVFEGMNPEGSPCP